MAVTPNYTTELTAEITGLYENGTTVEDIATAVGKSVRSVRSKLVREGVYVATPTPEATRYRTTTSASPPYACLMELSAEALKVAREGSGYRHLLLQEAAGWVVRQRAGAVPGLTIQPIIVSGSANLSIDRTFRVVFQMTRPKE